MDFLYETYEGKEPYIFVSYSHQDSQLVLPLIHGLQKKGFRVWYDAGIEVGAEWPEYIAEHLYACDCVLAFISPNAIASPNCRQEINYAIDLNKKTVAIYLEDMELSKGMQMRLGAIQAIYYSRFANPEAFLNSLVKADVLEASQGGQETAQKEQEIRAAVPEKVTTEQPKPKPKIDWKKYLVPAVAAVLAVVLLIALVGEKPEKPVAQEDPVQQTQEDTAQQTQAAAQPAAPQEKLSNVLMENPATSSEEELEEAIFNTQVLRKEVATLTFLDTLTDVPADAVDASLAQDGGVKAWAVKNGELYDLYIAAEGGVYAPQKACYLFYQMVNLKQITFGGAFHTENATDFGFMFAGDKNLTQVDLECLVTENATTMMAMFMSCESLETMELGNFDTQKVENMRAMFRDCKKLKELKLDSFRTEAVKDMSLMFCGCKQLRTLNLNKFITSNVTDMSHMFQYCEELTDLKIDNFNTTQVRSMAVMFGDCKKLPSLNVAAFRAPIVEDMNYMFANCSSLESLKLDKLNAKKVKLLYSMFSGCSALKDLDLSGLYTDNAENMEAMFRDCISLKELQMPYFNTEKVETMHKMFYNCSSLANLELSSFQTGSVKNMAYMFGKCSSLETLTLGESFDTSAVENMEHMFSYCYSLENLDVTDFQTGNVTNFYGMFYDCGCAADVDVTKFDVSKAEKYDFFLPEGVQVKGKPWKEMFA